MGGHGRIRTGPAWETGAGKGAQSEGSEPGLSRGQVRGREKQASEWSLTLLRCGTDKVWKDGKDERAGN